ncbi:unnamed protein product [Rotaria socialis]|uniref:Uncharacterized protein n=1 Tax=Rotaria socialis TaxID=392032 RepID=A0A817VHP3_9BILA|nr:unnamed protein product [Rotaria socialis]CAF4768406.1 unnamed protein product [Rotaria socialis]
MIAPNGNSHSNMELQQPVYMAEENSDLYRVLNNVPLASNNETTKEQQIVYYTTPANIQPVNSNQPYVCVQQLPNNQIVNQYSPTSVFIHHQPQQQQQSSLNNNVAHAYAKQPMLHFNMIQQQAVLSIYRPVANIMEMPPSSMINPTVASTPIPASAKRGRNDTSGISDSNIQVKPQYPQITQIFNTNDTSIKRHHGMNEPIVQSTDNLQQPASASCPFATTRFPFSPFSVHFSQEVRDKIAIDDLTKHASEHLNFDLRMVPYRRGRAENNECRILIFVENSESFVFLYNQENWPTSLSGSNYTIKRPSIPPQLALVIPAVSL